VTVEIFTSQPHDKVELQLTAGVACNVMTPFCVAGLVFVRDGGQVAQRAVTSTRVDSDGTGSLQYSNIYPGLYRCCERQLH